MSLEFWTAIAQVGTFIVIAATAIAAIVQLRHLRSANKIAAIQTFFAMYEGSELRDAFHFVRSELQQRLQNPEFRSELRAGDFDRAKHPEIQICNFFDQWGLYYRDGVIDRHSFLRVNAGVINEFWDRLAPVIALIQSPTEGNKSFQQFEYLTSQARRWLTHYPGGDFPTSVPRIPLTDPWQATDSARNS